MTTNELYKELSYVNHSREKRLYYAQLVLNQPELISDVIAILQKTDDKISIRAAWVLEFMCKNNLSELIPYLDVFTETLTKLHLDSAVRPAAKICEYIAKAYYSKLFFPIQKALTQTHQERIIESCFDWLLNDEKIAVKAYAMQTLFLFGNDVTWIYTELEIILERDYAKHSAAYKARARIILKKIKANNQNCTKK